MKILVLATDADAAYIPRLKALLAGNTVAVKNASGRIWRRDQLEKMAAKLDFDYIVTCDWEVAQAFTGKEFKPPGTDGPGESIYDYGGSFGKVGNCYVLLIPPPAMLVKTNEGEWLFKRWLSKITHPESWPAKVEHKWTVVNTIVGYQKALARTKASPLVAIDIETGDNFLLREFGWAVYDEAEKAVHSFVIYPQSVDDVDWIAEICDTDVPKVMQNGIYDSSWLLAYNCPVRRWELDTLGMMHSYQPELSRDLGFIAALFIREIEYWKNDSESSDAQTRALYNAKDTYTTLVAASNMLVLFEREAPYAFENFKLRFPMVFPSVHESMEGFVIDPEAKAKMAAEQTEALESALGTLRAWLRWPNFNPNSPVQVAALFRAVHPEGKYRSSDAAAQTKFAKSSPLAKMIADEIENYRGASKLLSTYVNALPYVGRFMYSLNPFGAETCRSTSKKSHFYLMQGKIFKSFGGQVQNVPAYVKEMLQADAGWAMADIDKSASESWCTAALSKEGGLWAALESGKDFHCYNGSMFFGMTYELVVAERKAAKAAGKKDGEIRILSKRINHGANYNMMAAVMVATMGEDNVFKAKRLLMEVYTQTGHEELQMLRRCISAEEIAAYLLYRFEKVYPRIRANWQQEIIAEVKATRQIKSPSGWTRATFLKPWANKLDLNACVAHGPQHLSVHLLDVARYKNWKQFALGTKPRIRPKAQVHDALTFCYRPNDWQVVDECEANMRISLELGYEIDGVPKVLCIPNDAQGGGTHWATVGKSEWRN